MLISSGKAFSAESFLKNSDSHKTCFEICCADPRCHKYCYDHSRVVLYTGSPKSNVVHESWHHSIFDLICTGTAAAVA